MSLNNEIKEIFEENGIDILDNEQLTEIDSLQYMTIIVEIEQKYSIVFPDAFLEKNMAEDYHEFVKFVTMLINSSVDESKVTLLEDIKGEKTL